MYRSGPVKTGILVAQFILLCMIKTRSAKELRSKKRKWNGSRRNKKSRKIKNYDSFAKPIGYYRIWFMFLDHWGGRVKQIAEFWEGHFLQEKNARTLVKTRVVATSNGIVYDGKSIVAAPAASANMTVELTLTVITGGDISGKMWRGFVELVHARELVMDPSGAVAKLFALQ